MNQTNYIKTIEPWRATPDQLLLAITILIFIIGVAVAYNTLVETNTKNLETIKEYNKTQHQFDLNTTQKEAITWENNQQNTH